MYTLGRSGRSRSINIWPGFVDGLATLLLVVIFVLMVFIVAQYFLSIALTGKDERLAELDQQIAELADLLALERSANAELRINVTQLSSELQSSLAARDDLAGQLAGLSAARDELAAEVRSLGAARDDLTAQLAALAAERETLAGRLDSVTENRDELAQQLAAMTMNRNDLEERVTALGEVRDQLSSRLEVLEAERRTLSDELAVSKEDRDRLAEEVAALVLLRERLSEELKAEQERSAGLDRQLADAFTTIEVDREKIETQLIELAILKDLREQLERQLAERERVLAALKSEAEERSAELGLLSEDKEDLEARLTQRDETLADLKSRLSEAQGFAMEQQQLSDEAQRKVDLLNRQLLALRQQIATLNEALEASESLNEEQQVQIADLGKRLNVALAGKVQELARYRSEFFGRLRQVLGDNPNVRIVGDRFVFQAEVLFPSGSAELEPEGRAQIGRLAETLRVIAGEIPEDIDWVLRVDGHTDVRPIRTLQFPSNWELSSARAIAVVKFLISQGLPANRLVAAGFGEYQPIDAGADEIAYRRNRRIEFKLTER